MIVVKTLFVCLLFYIPSRNNAIQLCHPLFITHIFRGGKTLQSKKQYTIQAIAMCNLLVISNVCKIASFSCCFSWVIICAKLL